MSNEIIETKSFSENLLELNSFYEENKTLTALLEENFDILEQQILKHKCVKNINKNKKNDLKIEESFYINLSKTLKNSKEFYGQEINPSTLASTMSRIRDRKGLSKYSRTDKKMVEVNNPVQVVVSTPVITEQQPARERPQKKNKNEASVVVEKSQQASQVGNLSTVQVSQAPLKEKLTSEEEKILLNLKKTNFDYSQLIKSLDTNPKLDKSYGAYEQEQKMEELTKVIFKLFEINYPDGNYDILSDAHKRLEKFNKLKVSEPIRELGAHIWGRIDLIKMLMSRYEISVKNK